MHGVESWRYWFRRDLDEDGPDDEQDAPQGTRAYGRRPVRDGQQGRRRYEELLRV